MSTMEEHEREQDEITARYDATRGRSDKDEEQRIELSATVNGVELYGTHPMAPDRMKDQDLLDAVEDLMSEIPEGTIGQVVEVLDANGKSRGTIVYGEDGWDADAIR